MKARLQLKDYWLEDLQWSPVEPPAEPLETDDSILPKLRLSVLHKEDSSDYLCKLQIFLTKGRALKAGAPYHFRLQLFGQFEFLEGTSTETQHRMIHVNGSSILYGVARGVLAEATSQARAGKYILPAINLIELLEKRGHLEGTVKPAIP